MKVVCESCATRYSIDDDKLAGKVFKIRCRKCATVIVVRGAGAGVLSGIQSGAESGVMDAASGPVAVVRAAAAWHAVQDGQQVGPFDSGEIQRRRAAGELDDESYVWRDGFAEWQPLGQVDELRPAVAPAAAAAPVSVVPAAVPQAAAAPGASGGGALFGGAAQRSASGSKLHGERNESSALFTLAGLSKLGAPGTAPAAAPAGPRTGAGAGAAAGEGSGLIDIRSLARSYAPVTGAGVGAAQQPSAPAAPAARAADELPMFTSGAFATTGVLVPTAPRRDRRIVAGLAAVAGLLAICFTLLIVVVLTRRGEPSVAKAPRPETDQRIAKVDPAQPRTAPAVVEAPVAPRVETPAPRTEMPATAPAPAPRTEPPAPAPTSEVRTPAPQPRTRSPQPRTPSPQPRTRTPEVRTPEVRTPAPTPAPAAKCDQVTCIVNGYDGDCCKALRGQAPSVTPGPGPSQPRAALPENLDRAAITAGLATISTKRCAGLGASGLVKARVKVAAGGSVTTVDVLSTPDDALGACVAEQAKKGRFKPTQRGTTFSYVWRF